MISWLILSLQPNSTLSLESENTVLAQGEEGIGQKEEGSAIDRIGFSISLD